jgi:hypothetical protein
VGSSGAAFVRKGLKKMSQQAATMGNEEILSKRDLTENGEEDKGSTSGGESRGMELT